MTISVGFTGTRHGMTAPQRRALALWLRQLFEPQAEFHHGDCLGADAEAHDLAREIGYVIHAHPGNSASWRACKPADHVYEPRAPLVRNSVIVNMSQVMLAAPHEARELQRSGTWSTVRHARKTSAPLVIVFPDGTYKLERLIYDL